MTTAANSMAAHIASITPMPPSFNGGDSLFLFNLFVMTAAMSLGAMMMGKQARRIWAQRWIDHPLDPVTLYRGMMMLFGCAIMVRCGAEAMALWGWSPDDPVTSARVSMAKRWLDPLAVACGLAAMAIAVLGEPGIESQLRKAPLPVDMWSRWPALVRAGGVVVTCFIAALAAVLFR